MNSISEFIFSQPWNLHTVAAETACDAEGTLNRPVLRVQEDFYRVGDAASSLIRGLKAAVSLQGICGFTMASPYMSATPEEIGVVATNPDQFQNADSSHSVHWFQN